MTQKQELREKIKQKIKGLTAENKITFSTSIADKLLGLKEYIQADTIFIYNSFGYEVSTDYIIKSAQRAGKKVCLPITVGDMMYATRVDADTLYEQNDWGIMEPISKEVVLPEDIDLCIVPLVGFDKRGNRLGRGKGYYDRYLKDVGATKVALAYSVQEEQEIAIDAFDVKVNFVITEREVISASSGIANGIFG